MDIFFLLSLILYLLSIFKPSFLIMGILSHSIGLGLRTIISGHLPFTSLYESLVFFSWLIGLFYLVMIRLRKIAPYISLMISLIMGYALFLPERYKEISPLVPALRSNWLGFHVTTCFLGYTGFTFSFIASILYLIKKDLTFDVLSGKMIKVGFFFLTLGIITGSIWAYYAWGSYWSWDPKETWSLITWLVYTIYLHTRNYGGKTSHIFSIIGFIFVLFTYLGVNLLGGLHSY